MRKWVLCEKQEGEGCDYTIGCGRNWTVFEAPNEEAAWKEVCRLSYMDEMDDGRPYGAINVLEGEQAREKFVLFEIAREIDLLAQVRRIVSTWKDGETTRAAREKEDRERAEFERLKKKFG